MGPVDCSRVLFEPKRLTLIFNFATVRRLTISRALFEIGKDRRWKCIEPAALMPCDTMELSYRLTWQWPEEC